MKKRDDHFLELAIKQAEQSRKNGNHPFGALLVDENQQILLAAENTVVTQKDVTAHAEINLIRAATKSFSADKLSLCTLYSSAEPCPMCASAMVWANIRHVVFALGMDKLYSAFGDIGDAPTLKVESREIFKFAPWSMKVIGPMMEKEALGPHSNFW